MATPFRRDDELERQGQFAAVVVVVIGYAATFVGTLVGASLAYTWTEAATAVLLGLVYVFLLWRGDDFFVRYPSSRGRAVYFTVQLFLVIVVQYLLIGPGTWLIPLPIVAIAVERVPPRGRWPIFLAIILGLTLSLGVRTGDWSNTLNTPLLLVPAVVFVVVVTQGRVNERQARWNAEELSAQLETAHDQLAAYAIQAEELATTKERNRLAREIHDNLGHYLTVTNVQLEAARAVMETEPERALDALGKAQASTKEGLAAVRQSVASLRESPVANRTLSEALDDLLDETRAAGIVVEFTVVGASRKIDAKTKLTLYRVAQEGLTNVRKHARASRVDIILEYGDGDNVRLMVRDNGIGTGSAAGGFGLIGMLERVQLLNGDLQVETAPAKGFELKVSVPG
jgi:signal transduction histidine kinase